MEGVEFFHDVFFFERLFPRKQKSCEIPLKVRFYFFCFMKTFQHEKNIGK